MDMHRIGKEGFANPSSLIYLAMDGEKTDEPPFSLQRVCHEAQVQYYKELEDFLKNNPEVTVYRKPWATRVRRIKIWNPDEQTYNYLTLQLYKVGRKLAGEKRRKIYTFTGTLVSTYGRYLRIDAFMFVAFAASYKHSGGSLGKLYENYDLPPGSCRKWAKDLLPLLGVPTSSDVDIWEECYEHTKNLHTSTEFRQFFKASMANVTKGMFATYIK